MDYKNFIYKNKPIIEMEKNISKESLINNFKDPNISTFELNNLKILTYNIWGVDNDHQLHFNKRMEQVSYLLNDKENLYDIVCLQEVSRLAYKILEHYHAFKNYKYISHEEREIANNRKDDNNCCRDIDNIILIRNKIPISLLSYKVFSSKEYKYSIPLTIAIFNNLLVVNIHTISGVTNSYKRFYQLRHIFNIVKNINKNNNLPTIICGDFNFDLNKEHTDIKFDKSIYKDNFVMDKIPISQRKEFKIVGDSNNIYTEDTLENYMRWNIKFANKLYKYDGFIINSGISDIQENLIGNNVFYVEDEDEYNKIKVKAGKENQQPRGLKDPNLIPLFPSDHFGVVLEFSINSINFINKYKKYKKKYIELKKLNN